MGYNQHEMLSSQSYNTLWLPPVQICRTFSGGRPRVLQAARMLRSARRPRAPTRTRSSPGHVTNYSPHSCTLRQPKISIEEDTLGDAHSGEMYKVLRKEGQADRNGRLGKTNHFARECELVVDPDGRRWPRTREPINRDPCEHCESGSARLGADIYVGVNVPSSSVQGYESVQVTSFSYIHASKPTGESARLNPCVCGLVDCSV